MSVDNDTFKGKKGKELDTVDYTVKRLNTWSTKTLEKFIVLYDHVPGDLPNSTGMEYRTRCITQAAMIALQLASDKAKERTV